MGLDDIVSDAVDAAVSPEPGLIRRHLGRARVYGSERRCFVTSGSRGTLRV